MFSILLSLVIGALVIIGNRTMLGILFGKVEDSIMQERPFTEALAKQR